MGRRQGTSTLQYAIGLIFCFSLGTFFIWIQLPGVDTDSTQAPVGPTPGQVHIDPWRDRAEPEPDEAHHAHEQDQFEEVDEHVQAGNGCVYAGPKPGFLGGCATDCRPYPSLAEALNVCAGSRSCGGVTASASKRAFELRQNPIVRHSQTAEMSYVKQQSKECHNLPEPPPPAVHGAWQNPIGVDLDTLGSFVDNQPTIFISIAAYRDPMCHITIANALRWAAHPSRLVFGVVQQNAEGDEPCLYTKAPCDKDPGQLLCKYRKNIRVDEVPAIQARGPTFGRHRADQLYNGEYYALQIDAHMYFVDKWDEQCIRQFEAAGNDYAIMSTYPSEAKGNVKDGVSRVGTTPGICKSAFLGDGLIRHGAAGEFYPDTKIVGAGDQPVLQPWWAAGLSFSRGHKVARVPNDCCTPMTFNGEEFSMAFRQWTHGYDHYTFRTTVALHPYTRRKKPPLFWENGNRFPGDAEKSGRRLQEMFGMRPMQPGMEFDRTDMEKYGLGSRRPLSKFLRVFGVDFSKRTVRDHCRGVQNCHMHRALVKFMRPDMKGIDYERVPDDIGKQW